MGYDQESITVTAYVSRHNSPRDDEHDALWGELRDRIRAIVSEDEYEVIRAEAY